MLNSKATAAIRGKIVQTQHLALSATLHAPINPSRDISNRRIFDFQLTHPSDKGHLSRCRTPERPRIQITVLLRAVSEPVRRQSTIYTFYIMRATKRTDLAGLTEESPRSLFISIYGLIDEI